MSASNIKAQVEKQVHSFTKDNRHFANKPHLQFRRVTSYARIIKAALHAMLSLKINLKFPTFVNKHRSQIFHIRK